MRVMFLLLSLVAVLYGQMPTNGKPQVYNFTKQEGLALVNSLFKACNPDKPENAYMPLLLRQKLRWVYIEKLSHRLNTGTVFNENCEFGSISMFARYGDNGLPYIGIVVDDVLLSVRVDSGHRTGFGREDKNSFCMRVAHEAVHLEQPKSFFVVGKRTRAEIVQEEFRTYKKLEPVVIELQKKNEPLDKEHIEMYKIITRCPGPMACSAFKDHFSKNAGNIPTFPAK